MIEETLCPKCGEKMKPAKSKHGAYWRCPKWGCEGTRDSMGRSKEEREAGRENDDDERSVG